MAHPSQLPDCALGFSQVLENLEAGDHVGAVIGEWQHPSICPDAGGGGKPLEGHGQLVPSILNSDQRAGTYLHRLQRQSLADADIDPGAAGRAGCHPELAQQAGDQLSNDDVVTTVFCLIFPCGLN